MKHATYWFELPFMLINVDSWYNYMFCWHAWILFTGYSLCLTVHRILNVCNSISLYSIIWYTLTRSQNNTLTTSHNISWLGASRTSGTKGPRDLQDPPAPRPAQDLGVWYPSWSLTWSRRKDPQRLQTVTVHQTSCDGITWGEMILPEYGKIWKNYTS